MTEHYRIEICTDCLLILANGECTDPDHQGDECEHSDALNKVWPVAEYDITLGHLHDECDDDDHGEYPEPWFSMSACEGCGSRLGGDREFATAWKRGSRHEPVPA